MGRFSFPGLPEPVLFKDVDNLHPIAGDFLGEDEPAAELRCVAGAEDTADPGGNPAADDFQPALHLFGLEPVLYRRAVRCGEQGATATAQFVAQKHIANPVVRAQLFHSGAGKVGQFFGNRSGVGTDVEQNLDAEFIKQTAELVFRAMTGAEGIKLHFWCPLSTGNMEDCRFGRVELIVNLYRLWSRGGVVVDVIGLEKLNGIRA